MWVEPTMYGSVVFEKVRQMHIFVIVVDLHYVYLVLQLTDSS